ncbi:hypothetical protein QPK13_23775 [Photorhabdus tasmaniensis]
MSICDELNTLKFAKSIEWLTINEAVYLINKECNTSLSESHIYRLALNNEILLSIYFQSPIILKKIVNKNDAILKKDIDSYNLLYKLCFLNPMDYKYYRNKCCNAIAHTEGEFIFPDSFIWDTKLIGIESIAIQKYLANSLGLPEPIVGQYQYHCGVLVNDDDNNTYQVFEKKMVKYRIQTQLESMEHSEHLIFRAVNRIKKCRSLSIKKLLKTKMFFPIYQLPNDAFFVIKKEYVNKFIAKHSATNVTDKPEIRMSSPLARFLWLACKNNPLIGTELIQHPYKLLALFEVWAKEDGISDKLSGDTLKKALSRGSPVV